MKFTLFVTYCAVRKAEKPGLIPAIKRYLSPRIKAIFQASHKRGAAFAILSGQYGLIGPYKKIPHYDHLLAPHEVKALLPQMTDYLTMKKYRSVLFFHESTRLVPQLKPYCKAITTACRGAGVHLKMVKIGTTVDRFSFYP